MSNGSGWRAWQDSNPQPLGPKPSALSIELQAQRSYVNAGELGRATGFEPVISCATDRRLRPLGYARRVKLPMPLPAVGRRVGKLAADMVAKRRLPFKQVSSGLFTRVLLCTGPALNRGVFSGGFGRHRNSGNRVMTTPLAVATLLSMLLSSRPANIMPEVKRVNKA